MFKSDPDLVKQHTADWIDGKRRAEIAAFMAGYQLDLGMNGIDGEQIPGGNTDTIPWWKPDLGSIPSISTNGEGV